MPLTTTLFRLYTLFRPKHFRGGSFCLSIEGSAEVTAIARRIGLPAGSEGEVIRRALSLYVASAPLAGPVPEGGVRGLDEETVRALYKPVVF